MNPVARLRVATLNVWGLPGWLTVHASERMRAIGARLAEMDVDVLGVQELWTPRLRRELLRAAAPAGFREVWYRQPRISGSGLAILSRIPLADVRFQSFSLCGLPQRLQHGDYWSGKGFAIATISTAAGEVALLDTHLHAQYAPDAADEYRAHRVAEMVEIAAALAQVAAPVIALGDFNSREGGLEYEVLTGLSGLRDVAAELDRRQPTVLGEHPYRSGRYVPEERIDYVFIRDGREAALRSVTVQRVFDDWLTFGSERGAHSDHAGVWAELELWPRAGVATPPTQQSLTRAEAELTRGVAAALRRRGVERVAASGGLLTALAAAAASRTLRNDRRGFLRAALRMAALACLGFGLGEGILSEHYAPAELEAFSRILDTLHEMDRRDWGRSLSS